MLKEEEIDPKNKKSTKKSSKKSKSPKHVKRSADKKSSLIFSTKDENRIQIIQPSVLTDLGDVKHAIFDKTDTLTLSTIEIVQIASSTKLYNLNVKTLFQIYREVRRDPTKYQRMEDLEEVMKQKEDDNYSEKSQEFHKEVRGEYDAQVFDEDFHYDTNDIDAFEIFSGKHSNMGSDCNS